MQEPKRKLSAFERARERAPKLTEPSRDAQRVLRCPHCGAAQEQAQKFVCNYCRKSIVETDPEEPA